MKHAIALFVALLLAAFLALATLAAAAAPKEVAVPVAYSAPDDGFVSLALYNDRGQLVRSLLYAQRVKAGSDSIAWDGTSDLGIPQPAGNYSTKAIFFKEKPRAEYVMTVGKSGNPPYRTPDGKGDWGGNLGGPAAICANSHSLMMVWSCVEDNQITGIQQMDPDGNIVMRYFSFYPWDSRLAGTMDDRNFYLGILHADKKQVEIAAYEIGKPRGKILTVLPTRPHEEGPGTRWSGRFTASINGMALTADTIFATITADDALFVVNRASGRIRKQVTITSPRDVKVAKGGLIVQAGNKIVRLTLDGKVQRTLVAERHVDQSGSVGGGWAGRLFFQRRQWAGRPLQRRGKAPCPTRQGRGRGKDRAVRFIRFRQHHGDVPGAEGRFAVGAGRRHRLPADLALDAGRASQAGVVHAQARPLGGAVNPARPNELLSTSDAFCDEPGIRAYAVDWAKKTWRPAWFYDNTWDEMFACNDVYLGYGHGGNPLKGPRNSDTWPTFHYAGRRFVSHGGKKLLHQQRRQRRRCDLPILGRPQAPARRPGRLPPRHETWRRQVRGQLRSRPERVDDLGRPQRRRATCPPMKSRT